ncbi:hypothetical protein SDC9_101907 [bioreactor metagenome]|uniref:Uncharacterized protein n=1 Tax=bioreactor metagenome TaxID=1076179 RepID=A0A645APD8_9ZZZZ
MLDGRKQVHTQVDQVAEFSDHIGVTAALLNIPGGAVAAQLQSGVF